MAFFTNHIGFIEKRVCILAVLSFSFGMTNIICLFLDERKRYFLSRSCPTIDKVGNPWISPCIISAFLYLKLLNRKCKVSCCIVVESNYEAAYNGKSQSKCSRVILKDSTCISLIWSLMGRINYSMLLTISFTLATLLYCMVDRARLASSCS